MVQEIPDMKIAIFATKFPALSQTFVLNHIIFLLEYGIPVDIYAASSKLIGFAHADVAKNKLIEKATYIPAIPNNIFFRVIKGLFLFAQNFHRNPTLLIRSLFFNQHQYKAFTLRALYWVIPFLQDQPEYDIIHCHFGPNGIKAMILRELGAIKGKLVVTFHGYDISMNIQKRGPDIYNALWQKGDCFLTVSECMRNDIIKLGCPASKALVHRMGVALDTATGDNRPIQTRQLAPKKHVSLLSVCRLVPKKGIRYAIEALAAVRKARPDLKFQYKIIGDGPCRQALEQQVREHALEDRVTFLGFKDRSEVAEIMQISDILIAPSVTAENGDKEGIPVVLMEAMSIEIPVLSTFHSGIPELVEDGISGFLAEEKDVHSLSKKLEILIENDTLRKKMGQFGKRLIQSKYNLEKLNKILIELYGNLINRQSQA